METSSCRLGCLIMAAGNARRFGENKLAMKLDGKSLIRRAMEAVPGGVFSAVTVVTQYEDVERLAGEFGFAAIHNAHPDWGISYTIRLGTKAMADCDAILYLVSDQPLLRKETVRRVAETWCDQPERIVGAAHDGKRGNPCMFPARYFEELCKLREDHGGNTVIKAGGNLAHVVLEAAQRGNLVFVDDDTVTDYADLRLTGDLAVLYVGAGNEADVRYVDDLADLRVAEQGFPELGSKHALHGGGDFVDAFVNYAVGADFDALTLRGIESGLIGTDVEAYDDGG